MKIKLKTFIATMVCAAALAACGDNAHNGGDNGGSNGNEGGDGPDLSGVRAVLLLREDGTIDVRGREGRELPECSVSPKSDKLSQCKGLQEGATVQDIQSISVIRSKINPTCATFIISGIARQVCW